MSNSDQVRLQCHFPIFYYINEVIEKNADVVKNIDIKIKINLAIESCDVTLHTRNVSSRLNVNGLKRDMGKGVPTLTT